MSSFLVFRTGLVSSLYVLVPCGVFITDHQNATSVSDFDTLSKTPMNNLRFGSESSTAFSFRFQQSKFLELFLRGYTLQPLVLFLLILFFSGSHVILKEHLSRNGLHNNVLSSPPRTGLLFSDHY